MPNKWLAARKVTPLWLARARTPGGLAAIGLAAVLAAFLVIRIFRRRRRD